MLSILKDHSILYVEDEPEIQANIAEYLESYFSTVYVASDGKEALSQYHMHHPDVLLLDINLPLLDGLSLAKKIRESDKIVKIIMLTAHTEKEKLLKATELKLTKYLIKPIAPKLFKETLEILSHDLQQNPSHFIHISNECIWDKKQETLSINDIHIPLNNKEHRLLKLLITSNKNSTISYEDIMVTVWEDSFERDISIDSIKNLVSQLRKKLPEHCISSVYGKGYVLK